MARARQQRAELSDLLGRRPGWRLEPRTTPGASPLWCFVADGEVEFAVTAERGAIRLYVMATDREISFHDADELTRWLAANRAEALQEAPATRPGASRYRGFFEWR